MASIQFVFLEIARGERKNISFKDIWCSFADEVFSKIFLVILLETVYLFLWSLVFAIGAFFFLEGFGYYVLASAFGANTGSSMVFMISGIGIMIWGCFLVIKKSLSYSMSYYLLYNYVYYEDNYPRAKAIISSLRQYGWSKYLVPALYSLFYFL
ncbi:DUF975 family protein [Streptococcus dentiloxodontae]